MKRALLLALVGLSLMGYSLYRRHSKSADVMMAEEPSSISLSVNSAQAAGPVGTGSNLPATSVVSSQGSSATPAAANENTPEEQRSLNDMTRVLTEFSRPGRSLEQLVKMLKDSRQEPTLTRDSNPYTGSMTIVRTKSPLPGTRYFHAQYLSDDSSPEFVQHMSFEVKAGPQAMAQTVAAVKKTMGPKAHLRKETKDFMQWELGDGYVIWIKKMNLEDLEENPFNAYSKADVGTIRVALEIDEQED